MDELTRILNGKGIRAWEDIKGKQQLEKQGD